MDAFETAQNCRRDGKDYACGLEATLALIGLITREVRCEGQVRDRYSRPLVHCFVGDLNLGWEIVRLGCALSEYGTEYRVNEQIARAARVGAWAGTFTKPRERRQGIRAKVDRALPTP